MSNLVSGSRNGNGNQNTTKTAPPLDAERLAERVQELSAGVLVRDDEGNVSPVLRRIVTRAAEIELKLEAMDAKAHLTTREEERRRQLENDHRGFLADLGMSARSAIQYRPIAQQQAARRAKHAQPSEDLDHRRRVLGILMATGSIGSEVQAWAVSRDPSGEMALFDRTEREAMQASEPQAGGTVTEQAEYTPEAAQLRAIEGDVELPEEQHR